MDTQVIRLVIAFLVFALLSNAMVLLAWTAGAWLYFRAARGRSPLPEFAHLEQPKKPDESRQRRTMSQV